MRGLCCLLPFACDPLRVCMMLLCLQRRACIAREADMHAGAGADSCTLGAGRFAARYSAKKFSFMAPDNIRDKEKRRPDHPDYDASKCYIPPDWVKTYGISDGQQQWWQFKAENWDSVLLFKVGKCARPHCT